jgi:hypothetical protein
MGPGALRPVVDFFHGIWGGGNGQSDIRRRGYLL